MVAASKEKANYINFLWKGRLFILTTTTHCYLGNYNLIKIYFICYYLTLHYLPHTFTLRQHIKQQINQVHDTATSQSCHDYSTLHQKIAFRETFKFRIHSHKLVICITNNNFHFFVQNLYPAPLLLLLHYKCNNNYNQILHKCNNAMQYHFITITDATRRSEKW